MPLVSIILPVYNSKEEWLKESVNSVLNQTFKDFELIIINDASTNGIEKVIEAYVKNDNRIVYIKNERNLKLTKTLNKWISLAKGKYVARIDDDDIREDKEKLWKQVNFMEDNDDFWLVWTNGIIINSDWEELYTLIRPSSDGELREKLIVWDWFIHSSVVIRKSVLDQVGWYDQKWNLVEDYELWLRIWKVSKMKIFSDSCIKYRQNTEGICNLNYRKQKRLTLKLFLKYFKYYPKKNILKALCFRVWELIIPPQITRYLLRKIGNVKI